MVKCAWSLRGREQPAVATHPRRVAAPGGDSGRHGRLAPVQRQVEVPHAERLGRRALALRAVEREAERGETCRERRQRPFPMRFCYPL